MAGEMDLHSKIERKEARVCVIGLGYVGLPLAVEFARLGFPVTGVDIDEDRVTAIRNGQSYIRDVSGADVMRGVEAGHLRVTTDHSVLAEMDVIFICVPTPFTSAKTPDLSYVLAAAGEIAEHLRPGQLVILQSTTYPGTTEEDVQPILERSGLVAGRDFHLAFSPERTNPGDLKHTVTNTPKVVGGVSRRCGELARLLLVHLMPEVHLPQR